MRGIRSAFVGAVLALWVLGSNAVAADVDGAHPEGWELVWADEFDGEGALDLSKWECEHGFVRNEELQWYQETNVFRERGRLVLEARREVVQNPHFDPNSETWLRARARAEYTSGSVITRRNVAFRYGRIEVCARIPALPGMWPAIWTTGRDGGWPQGGEIDIMEFYQNSILANFAWAERPGKSIWNTGRWPMSRFGGSDWAKKFHLWVLEWDEEKMTIFLDGEELNSQDLTKTFNKHDPATNPFRKPHRIRLNLAVGATGGDPSGTAFPQRYEIDFVRVYQRKAEAR